MNDSGWKAFGFEDSAPPFRTTAGACKPSGYAEYDGLTGYVDKVIVQEWIDQQGNHWRKTITVVNLGKPDRGIVHDPAAILEREPWSDEIYATPRDPNATPDPRGAVGRAAQKQHSRERHERAERIIAKYLTRNGPCGIWRLVSATGRKYDWMKMHLEAREGTVYCRVRKDGRKTIWGLVGVHEGAS